MGDEINNATELRRKAEEKLAAQSCPAETFTGELDAKRLLHELQVHQVELEFQNIALLESNNALILQSEAHKKLIEELKIDKETANHSKRIFLQNISHELRTPLNGVLGMAQLLEFTELTDEQKTYVETLNLSGNNLLSLIQDVLELSRIEDKKIVHVFDKFSLRNCISEVVLTQKIAISKKGLSLDVDVAELIPHVLIGDHLLLKQILLHLLGNAVKFTATGSIKISAQILKQNGDSLLIQITISDTGIGIIAEDIDKIFKPFTQADDSPTRNYGGIGIGLSICSNLAALLNGSISVESIPDEGSCFKLTIPFSI